MTLPLLRELRQRCPEAHICWICGPEVVTLLQATELINEIIVLDALTVGAVLLLWRKIFGRRFDLLFTLNPDPRYRLLTMPIFCKDRRQLKAPARGVYHVDAYLELLGVKPLYITFPVLRLPVNREEWSKPGVVLAPGGVVGETGKALRRWPLELYVAVAKELAGEAHIIIMGSRADRWICDSFVGVDDRVGQLELLDLLALLRRARLLIGHDSGALHLAKLVECPTLGLFGPTNPAEFAGEKMRVIWKGLACSPCYRGKGYARCFRNDCMRGITLAEVVAAAKAALLLEEGVK